MHRPRPAAVLVASLAVILLTGAPGLAGDVLDQARSRLASQDARGALVILEEALPADPSRRGAVLDLLRQAYAMAARQAESAGNARDAQMYRDNLEILNRKPKPAVAAAAAPAQEPARQPAEPPRQGPDPAMPRPVPLAADAERPRAPVDDALVRSGLPPPAEVPEGAPTAIAPPAEVPVRPASTPVDPEPPPAGMPAPGASPSAPQATVAAADAAFVAKRYDEAGRIYGTLLKEKRLPESRRDHLAYCRCAEVVRWINARPTRPEDWERINAEIRQIRELSPKNWYGDYLHNLVSERTSGTTRPRPSQKLTAIEPQPLQKTVVRAAAPEEPPPATAPTRKPAAPAAARPARAAAPSTTNAGGWQVHETANFRIMHADPALAERIAQVAEEAREIQMKRWMGTTPRSPWAPRCDIYVYPNSKVFCQMTNQPEESPGFSTMGLNAGRIIARRVNVRADHPNLLPAILPHEITHVVLADLFPNQQIPRWADEGMAVLSEPASEQRLRAADLEKPLASGRLFKLNDLMVMDYPDGKYWGLYYAQSVSVTRFLVEQGTPDQFVKFVQGAQQNGLEAELKRVYQIDSLADLQQRWLTYARTHTAEATAAAPSGPSATTNRE